jgi:hypothetical protein
MKIGKVKARFSKAFSKLKSFLLKENEKNATRRQLIIIDIMKNFIDITVYKKVTTEKPIFHNDNNLMIMLLFRGS